MPAHTISHSFFAQVRQNRKPMSCVAHHFYIGFRRTYHDASPFCQQKWLSQNSPNMNTGSIDHVVLPDFLHTNHPTFKMQCHHTSVPSMKFQQVPCKLPSTLEFTGRFSGLPSCSWNGLCVGSWVCGLVWRKMAKDPNKLQPICKGLPVPFHVGARSFRPME